MSESEQKMDDPRGEIDQIDAELLALLNCRAAIALRVGETKSINETPLCDTAREQQVLGRLSDLNQGPLDDKSIGNIFHRIIDESLLLQQQTYHRESDTADDGTARIAGKSRVAFLGDRGTFSEEAALGILGDDCETVSCPTFEDLFAAIDTGKADYILTPLENSLIGSVHRCVDLLLESELNIVAEIVLHVSHFLVGCEAATIETLKTVESHPAALAQCTRFFAAHPDLKRVSADDTAGSVRRAVESGDPTRAGIGGRRAAELYGGKVLREHIEDHAENHTRFALLSADAEIPATGSKISLVLRLKHQPGALHAALRPFVRRGLDLLKIESLPIKDSPGQFNFYLDIQAPAIEADLAGALADIEEQADDVRFLGRYSTTRLGTKI
ncbi:MAG: prephenate dehydratase [Pyrinomonadaceae bacterium]